MAYFFEDNELSVDIDSYCQVTREELQNVGSKIKHIFL